MKFMTRNTLLLALLLASFAVAQPNGIDSTVDSFPEDSLELFARIGESQHLSVAHNGEWPEETIASINIGKRHGKIRLIGIYPVSESGDWEFGTINVYDEKEKWIGYKTVLSHFNSECFDESIRRTEVYQEKNGKVVLIKKTVVTPSGEDLSKKKCVNPYASILPEIVKGPTTFEKTITKGLNKN